MLVKVDQHGWLVKEHQNGSEVEVQKVPENPQGFRLRLVGGEWVQYDEEFISELVSQEELPQND
jgi:hypothetical protein